MIHEPWTVNFTETGLYNFVFRGKYHIAPTEALAICQALVDVKRTHEV